MKLSDLFIDWNLFNIRCAIKLLASTLTMQQFQNFSGLKLNVNGEFKFDMYQVEKDNKKSVSKFCHTAKNMHTALFLLYFVNQQLQNCCLLSNE